MIADTQTDSLTLRPDFRLALVITLLPLPLVLIQPWIALGVSLFGIFLLIQTSRIRLTFTPEALDVYQGDRPIRRFPYAEWQNWRIYWGPVPILFYFREVNSIHFLPMLFNPQDLRSALERHVRLG